MVALLTPTSNSSAIWESCKNDTVYLRRPKEPLYWSASLLADCDTKAVDEDGMLLLDTLLPGLCVKGPSVRSKLSVLRAGEADRVFATNIVDDSRSLDDSLGVGGSTVKLIGCSGRTVNVSMDDGVRNRCNSSVWAFQCMCSALVMGHSGAAARSKAEIYHQSC